jgi:hypothetical protein
MECGGHDALFTMALGMGAFSTAYFLLTAPAPSLAGWLYDLTGDAFMPILLAIALFVVTLAASVAFRFPQRGRPRRVGRSRSRLAISLWRHRGEP